MNATERERVRIRGLIGFACGAFLLFLHFFPLLFDLPSSAANVSPFDVSVFGIETVRLRNVGEILADPVWGRLGGAAALVLFAWAIARYLPGFIRGLERVWTRLGSIPERSFVLGVVLAQLVLLMSISVFVFDRMPHVQDEIGQYFQARIFASGALSARPPADPELFSFYSVILGERWYSQHPPGLPLLLAPLLLLGIPWLLNPLLGAGCTLLTYRLGRTLWGDAAGRGAALLLVLSPFHAFMGASFMNHTPTLFFLLLAAVLLLAPAPGSARSAAGGLALGTAALTRPLVSLALGVFLGALALARTERGARARPAAAALLGFALPLGFFLWYNTMTNGGPLTLGYTVADPAFHRMGFASAPVPYSPLRAWLKTAQLFRGLDAQLFAWPLPSLFLVWVLCLRGASGRRELALLAAALLVPFSYFGYWFQDMCLGPRFAYESLPLWALLSERSLASARSVPALRRTLAAFVVVCFSWAALASWPLLVKGYSSSYWGVDRSLTRTVEAGGIRDAVVLVPEEGPCPWYYGAGFWANDPELAGPVIYARDPGADAPRRIARSFPRRSVYRYDCAARLLLPLGPR